MPGGWRPRTAAGKRGPPILRGFGETGCRTVLLALGRLGGNAPLTRQALPDLFMPDLFIDRALFIIARIPFGPQ